MSQMTDVMGPLELSPQHRLAAWLQGLFLQTALKWGAHRRRITIGRRLSSFKIEESTGERSQQRNEWNVSRLCRC